MATELVDQGSIVQFNATRFTGHACSGCEIAHAEAIDRTAPCDFSFDSGKNGCGYGYLLIQEMLEMPSFVDELQRVRARRLPIDSLLCALCGALPTGRAFGLRHP
jgi:hypothetical protein